MHSGAEFSLKVVKWDERRKQKRGEVLEVPSAVLVWGDGGNDARQSERAPTDLERKLMGPAMRIDKRDPNHQTHYTRNIRVVVDGLQTETIYKIRPLLIIEFNGQPTMP